MFAARNLTKASARSFSTSARANTHVAVLGAAGKLDSRPGIMTH